MIYIALTNEEPCHMRSITDLEIFWIEPSNTRYIIFYIDTMVFRVDSSCRLCASKRLRNAVNVACQCNQVFIFQSLHWIELSEAPFLQHDRLFHYNERTTPSPHAFPIFLFSFSLVCLFIHALCLSHPSTIK